MNEVQKVEIVLLLLVMLGLTKVGQEVIRVLINGSAWSCLDVDSYILADTSGDVLVQLKKELYEKFGAYHYVCYSTASSTEKRPKFRLVFPLTKEVDAKDLSHFWFAMNKQFKEIGDEQTKGPCPYVLCFCTTIQMHLILSLLTMVSNSDPEMLNRRNTLILKTRV